MRVSPPPEATLRKFNPHKTGFLVCYLGEGRKGIHYLYQSPKIGGNQKLIEAQLDHPAFKMLKEEITWSKVAIRLHGARWQWHTF
jgi:hypothetical protein